MAERPVPNGSPALSHHHRQLTSGSGISDEIVAGRGYATVKSKAELRRLGFASYQQLVPALLIPMYAPDGTRIGCQIKPDNPRRDRKTGKEVKYETPAGSEVHLDMHPSQAKYARDASVPLWITEGVKKADSLVSQGLCALALQGVDCWHRGGIPLPEWEDLRLYGRQMPVAYDSDVSVKPAVQRSLERIVSFFEGRGACVRVVYLPDGPGGAKQGVDDYLVAGGTISGLEACTHDGIREDLQDVGRSLADVEPEDVEWLWPRRIPKGKITILDGDPDNGKSVLTTDLAARVTAGLALPDGTPVEAAGAVLVSAEDGAADTVRPRFDAAGGDPSKALLLGDEELFYIPEDVPLLERAIKQVGASMVVIDPIMAFLSGDLNSNRDQDVRRALTPLKRMAERTGAAVVLVRHLNKTPGGNPLYRGGGSIGIIGAARSGLVVGRDPGEEELRVLAGQKNNLSLRPESLSYSIETAENGAARIAYRGTSEVTASQMLQLPADEEEKSALAEAKDFLQSELKPGPMSANAVKRNAHSADISERTLKRAKKALKVKSEKESDGSWTWSLPKQGSQNSTVGPVGPLAPLSINKPVSVRKEGGQAENVGPLQNGSNPLCPPKGGQEDQGCQQAMCIHDHPGGKGCYLCDPNHPFRSKEEA